MNRILAFAGSNHSNSINYKLIELVSDQIDNPKVDILDIRSWVIPIYSIDMDPDQTPDLIKELIEKIQEYDGFIIASPEHNGSTPAFFKNILDWMSRRQKNVFGDKPMLLLSTSPGGKGGANHLLQLVKALPYQGAKVISSYSLPSFFNNVTEDGLVDEQHSLLREALDQFLKAFDS